MKTIIVSINEIMANENLSLSPKDYIKHKLIIHSCHDAQAECLCGWNFVRTGKMTKNEIMKEYHRHLERK